MNQCVNMTSDAPRELSLCEINYVFGGGNPDMADSTTVGTGAGAAAGILLTNTMRGGAMGGALGAALGFSFGAGWMLGSWIYRRVAGKS